MIVPPDTLSHVPGLPCRFPDGCPDEFVARLTHTDDLDALHWAARERDKHEQDSHGYVHPPPVVTKWHSPYTGRASR